jgi:hypothetical protein
MRRKRTRTANTHNKPGSPETASDPRPRRVKVREVTGIFYSREALEDAVDELMLAGFDRADIDLLADTEDLELRLGHLFANVEELADMPVAPRRPFVGRTDAAVLFAVVVGVLSFMPAAAAAYWVTAHRGSLWASVFVAIVGGIIGGGLGAWLTYRWLKPQVGPDLDRQIAEMGIVIWVRVRSAEAETAAQKILKAHGAKAVRVHEMEIDPDGERGPLRFLRPHPLLRSER